jgi:hypothetical protein
MVEIKDNLGEILSGSREDALEAVEQLAKEPPKEQAKPAGTGNKELDDLLASVKRIAVTQAPGFWKWLESQPTGLNGLTRGDISKISFMNGAIMGAQITLSYCLHGEEPEVKEEPKNEI